MVVRWGGVLLGCVVMCGRLERDFMVNRVRRMIEYCCNVGKFWECMICYGLDV